MDKQIHCFLVCKILKTINHKMLMIQTQCRLMRSIVKLPNGRSWFSFPIEFICFQNTYLMSFLLDVHKVESSTLSNLHSYLFAKIYNVKTITHGMGGSDILCDFVCKTFHINIQQCTESICSNMSVHFRPPFCRVFLFCVPRFFHQWPFFFIRKGWFHFRIIWFYLYCYTTRKKNGLDYTVQILFIFAFFPQFYSRILS